MQSDARYFSFALYLPEKKSCHAMKYGILSFGKITWEKPTPQMNVFMKARPLFREA